MIIDDFKTRDWATLEFYVYPHLMGEAVDYEIDESDEYEDDDNNDDKNSSSSNNDNRVERSADSEMAVEDPLATAVDAAAEELPGRMQGLQIARVDEDGDVEMMDL